MTRFTHEDLCHDSKMLSSQLRNFKIKILIIIFSIYYRYDTYSFGRAHYDILYLERLTISKASRLGYSGQRFVVSL